ncbi:tetratricopeptide repeat protein [bacterium]|nr:tetratricopeptide repeat protein [bacterium]
MRKILVLLVVFAVFLCGCAYLNTFYMAQKNYKNGERQRVRETGTTNNTYRKFYNDAVDGAARLIRDYPNSKYVDDSLFIIGMSYFYLGEYTRALTKYDEISEAFPESEFIPDVKYFKARCLIELDKYDDARIILSDCIENGNRYQKGRAGLSLADISFLEEKWDDLLAAAQNVIDSNPEKEELYQAISYKGEALYNLARYEECVQTLEELLKNKLEPELQVKTNLMIALAKGELGKFEEGLGYLTAMQNKGEYAKYDPRIRLQIGRIYELQGDTDKAVDTYLKLAGDYPDSVASYEAWYHVGKLRLQDFSNLDDAKSAFDKAKAVKARVVDSWLIESTNMSTQIDALKKKLETLDQLKNDPVKKAHERFSLAELYTFSFNRPDSALTQYRMILEEAPETDFAVRSEYFLGLNELRSENRYSEEADHELMSKIIEKYPESNFSQELRVFLGVIEKPPEIRAFQEAEQARISGKGADVYMPLYQAVADSFPDTKSAYQARFIMAYFYEHDVGNNEKAIELYTELTKLEKNVYRKDYVELATSKLEHMKEEPKLLKDIEKNIVYLTYGIGKTTTETPSETPQVAVSASKQDEEMTGLKKIRARNARIRSRYYSN